MTNQKLHFGEEFPYFGNWREYQWHEVYFYIHRNQKLFVHEADGMLYFLIGHAYDPFAVIADEQEILERLAAGSGGDFEKAIPYIDDLTGLFLMGFMDDKKLTFWGDFESMRATYFGQVGEHWYLASHEELVALREELTWDPYVERLEIGRAHV